MAAAIGYSADDEFDAIQPYTSIIAQNMPSTAPPNVVTGRATVVDGDTIEISGKRVRFNGIDAQEGQQSCKDGKGRLYACGRAAANALDKFLAASRPVSCQFVDWDQYGRFLGNCERADGRSVQEWLVENGYALDWPRYSNGALATQEATARASKRGVWQGEFQKPWEWRATQRERPAPSTAAENHSLSVVGQSVCNIKGNINAKGERIYHVPGQKYYDGTKVSEANGERWFCTDPEARQAGWRKAKR